MLRPGPVYKLVEFVGACSRGEVFVTETAFRTASSDFNLRTKGAVMEFIAAGGMERPSYVKSDVLQGKWRFEAEVVWDAYDFYSGIKYGYMAFFVSPVQRWFLKSFKKNDKSDPRNLPFLALNKLPPNGGADND